MMRIVFFIISFFVLESCKDKSDICLCSSPLTTTQMNLQIIPDFDGLPLVMYKTYTFNGKPIQFTRFSFILSKLCDEPTGDCLYNHTQFDFSTLTDSISALKGLTNSININSNKSQIFRIGFGVDSLTNRVAPAQQNPASPLANGLNYWDAWNSFIFLKIEGKYDKNGDGTFETPFALHTGGDAIYSERKYELNNNLTDNSPLRLLFNINLAKVISGIDLNTTTQTHKTGDLAIMQTIMNNFNASFIYKGAFSK